MPPESGWVGDEKKGEEDRMCMIKAMVENVELSRINKIWEVFGDRKRD
jgi:hypothetical protein